MEVIESLDALASATEKVLTLTAEDIEKINAEVSKLIPAVNDQGHTFDIAE